MAVRRMTPLGQRLIAAGAQPERAQQFVERALFDKGAPAAMPSIGKPKAIDDAYDDELATISRTTWDKGFVPPSSDAPTFKTYFDLVKGKGAYDKFNSQSLVRLAPTYNVALKSPIGSYERRVADAIRTGKSPEELTETLFSFVGSTDPNQANLVGTRTRSDISSYVNKVFNEYNDYQAKLVEDATKELQKDKNFRYGLPDPRLRYGIDTNLSQGTVSVLTHPAVAKAYQNFLKTVEGDPVAQQKIGGWLARIASSANKAMETPWKTEVRRREELKKKTTRGG